MSKIIIFDNEKILIAELDRTETKKEMDYSKTELGLGNYNTEAVRNCHSAIFYDFKVIYSISLKKQLKRIEKILKYHKEKKK